MEAIFNIHKKKFPQNYDIIEKNVKFLRELGAGTHFIFLSERAPSLESAKSKLVHIQTGQTAPNDMHSARI